MTFTASDVLLKAASRIEEEGMWCQGSFYLGYPRHDVVVLAEELHRTDVRVAECAFAALLSAALELESIPQAHSALTRLQGVIRTNNLSGWNDTPGRTAHEVAEAMRAAALR